MRSEPPALPVASREARTFFVTGTPAPQGSKVRTRWGMRDDNQAALAPWRDSVIAAAERARGIEEPLDGPLYIALSAYFRRPGSHWGTGKNYRLLKASAPVRYHTRKPDGDKLARAALDALTIARLIEDDARVALLHVEKVWLNSRSDPPGMEITVVPLVES